MVKEKVTFKPLADFINAEDGPPQAVTARAFITPLVKTVGNNYK